jgi:hypothetical protein
METRQASLQGSGSALSAPHPMWSVALGLARVRPDSDAKACPRPNRVVPLSGIAGRPRGNGQSLGRPATFAGRRVQSGVLA